MAHLARSMILGLLLAGVVAPAAAQPVARRRPAPPPTTTVKVDPEAAAIEQAARDYIEGWWEGNAERMTRAVHPELVKRIVVSRGGSMFLDQMGASRLIAGTRAGFGKETPRDKQRRDVTILDRVGNAATVKVDAGEWVDYLHLGRLEGRWVIVNVLWELTPAAAPSPKPAPPAPAAAPKPAPPAPAGQP